MTKDEAFVDLLKHMLGMDSRYRKSQWGFRNRFVAGEGHSDLSNLKEMERQGLVVGRTSSILPPGEVFYRATEKGCEYAGLHKAGIKRAFED